LQAIQAQFEEVQRREAEEEEERRQREEQKLQLLSDLKVSNQVRTSISKVYYF